MQAPVVSPEAEVLVRLEAQAARVALPRGQWRLLGFGVASGVLLWLCHFPVGWGWLAWIALVPLLALVRAEARGRWLFLTAWAGGLAYYWPAISWMSVADPAMVACWALLATYCALYLPRIMYLARRFEKRLGLPLIMT